jgi:hypothetical protein
MLVDAPSSASFFCTLSCRTPQPSTLLVIDEIQHASVLKVWFPPPKACSLVLRHLYFDLP